MRRLALLEVGLFSLLLEQQRLHLRVLHGEVCLRRRHLRVLDREHIEQLAIRSRDLLRGHHTVHQVVEARGRQHKLDIVDRSVTIDVTHALVEQLVANRDIGLQPCQLRLPKADLPVELNDLGLGLGDERLLGRDLIVQALDQRVQSVDLRLHVVDLVLDVLQLPLVGYLLIDPRVIGDARLVDVGRIAGIAVDGRGNAARRRQPCQ